MKRNIFSIRRSLMGALFLVSAVALFSACKKDMGTNVNIPVSGLMAFNLATDKSGVGIDLSGNQLLGSPLAYTNYTGGYLNIYTGDRTIKSYNYSRDSALATSNFTFDSSKYYSVFVVGNNGVYQNLVVRDNFDSLSSTSGKAYVRYVNAIPDSSKPTVVVTSNEASIFNNIAPYASVSDFAPVTAGDINIAVSGSSNISAHRTITLEGGKAYTLLLVGLPAATDSAKTVQIKYVRNAG